jgi:TolA-binding protein
VDEMIAGALVEGRAADSFLAGLPSREAPPQAAEGPAPAEAFLAVRWLERRAGAEALKALVAAVARGDDATARVEDLLGLRFDAARALALAFARDEVRRRLDAETERLFPASLRAWEEGREEEALAAWRSLLERDPSGPLAPTLLYLGAKVRLAHGGEAAAAATADLERLLALPDAPWRPESLILLGERRRSQGDITGARRAWTEVLEAYAEDRLPAGRARAFLQATATAP